MKKLIIIAIFTLCLSLSGCSYLRYILEIPDGITKSWQTVTISGIGSFKIPSEWHIEQQDEIIYFTDKPLSNENYTIYLVGTARGIGIEPHEIFDEVEKGETFLSPFLNNGVSLLSINYIVDGIKETYQLILFYNMIGIEDNCFELFVWNRNVANEYITEQMALTFKSNREDFNNPNIGQLVP